MTDLETLLLWQLKDAGMPEPETQFRAVPGRRFAWDFAYPDNRLLVEVQGGTWVANTGHTSGRGVARDCEKANMATLHGWRVLLFTGDMVRDGTALAIIQQAMEAK